MSSRDWDFALGSLGDPLADILDWMLPPYPECLRKDIGKYQRGEIDFQEMKRRMNARQDNT